MSDSSGWRARSRPRRRRAGWALLAAAWAAAAAARGAPPAPRIVCDAPVCLFGERSDDREDLLHVFTLCNEGELTLRIEGVDTHCGCTDLALSREVLRPGETAELSVRLSLRGQRGAVEKYLVVRSNDPACPALKLSFRGRIEPEAEVVPRSILLGAVDPLLAATGQVSVVFRARSPDRVTGVRSTSPLFEGGFDVVETGRLYRVWARTLPPLDAAGSSFVRAELRVATASGRSPGLLVPVAASLLDALLVAPAAIIVPGAGEEVTRYASVRPGRVRRFRVTRVELPDPAMRATVEPLGEGGWRIRIAGIRPRPALDGLPVRIHTDAPGRPVFALPLRVVPDPP